MFTNVSLAGLKQLNNLTLGKPYCIIVQNNFNLNIIINLIYYKFVLKINIISCTTTHKLCLILLQIYVK